MGNENGKPSLSSADSDLQPGLLLVSDLTDVKFPLENLVFEGCGLKGYAYIGAIKALEKIGVLADMKRFSGVGTGSLIASLLAVGYDSHALQEFLDQHLKILVAGNQCNNNSLDELVKKFGWKSGHNFLDWMGQLLKDKVEDADITFQDLYEKTGKELCVVAMNLNQKQEEYFHPKTTPRAIVRRAIKMSITTPGVFQPERFGSSKSTRNYYLDGGVLCNYPIHCFDGWWLSMEPGKGIPLKSLSTTDLKALTRDRFSGYNSKTVGFTLFDDHHRYEELYNIMGERLAQYKADVSIPATSLGKKYKENIQREERLKIMFKNFPDAAHRFRKMLDELKNEDDMVSVSQLVKELTSKDSNTSTSDMEALFGIGRDEVECTALFSKFALDRKMLLVSEVLDLLEKISRNLYSPNKCTPRAEVTCLFSFWEALSNALHGNGKLSDEDVRRTIGIYTGHITCNDAELQEADEFYLFKQGWNSTVAFLRQMRTKI
ncbi:uncharacterized protein LOC115217505 isoform X1 [Argonauta hians]